MSETPGFEETSYSTENTADGDPFELKVDEATDYYRRMIFSDEDYYGPMMDTVLHEAIRQSLDESDEITIKKLSEHLGGPHPSEFRVTVSEGLQNLIWDRVQEMEEKHESRGLKQ